MALESATYIDGLSASNPPAGDPVTQADDHLRLIKGVLKNTFPNLDGAMTQTPEQLNGSCPTGLIAMWYSTAASVPSGWGLCDGSTYPRNDGTGNIVAPDLRDRFILAAGSTYAAGASGGSIAAITSSASGAHTPAGTLDTAGSHTHSGTTDSHVLTIAEMPAHSHTITGYAGASAAAGSYTLTGSVSPGTFGTSNTGGGDGHSHTITATDAGGSHTHTFTGTAVADHTHTITPTLPPYYVLAYMMRL